MKQYVIRFEDGTYHAPFRKRNGLQIHRPQCTAHVKYARKMTRTQARAFTLYVGGKAVKA